MPRAHPIMQEAIGLEEVDPRTAREIALDEAAMRDVPPGYLSDTRDHEGKDYRGIR